MTQLITKYAAKKMLGKQMDKYKKKDVAGEYDPYYCLVPHPTKAGKMRKVKKQIPDYIPEEDAVILAKMRQRAYWLDMSLFNLFGIRFGWSSVIGIIPAAGDVVDCAFAMLLFLRCNKVKCGLGSGVQLQMLLNIMFDFAIGLIPFIGDLFDASFRCNSRNVRLLEERLDEVYKPRSEKDHDKKSKHPRPPATIYEDFSDDETLPTHRAHSRSHSPQPQAPVPARVPSERHGGEKSYPPSRRLSKPSRQGSKRERQTDLEGSSARPSRNNSRRERQPDLEMGSSQPHRSNSRRH